MSKPPRERFIITVEPTTAEGVQAPIPIRLKRLLKTLGRGYALKVVSIKPEFPDPLAFAVPPTPPVIEPLPDSQEASQ